MTWKEHIFGLSVLASGLFVALAFYMGGSHNLPDASNKPYALESHPPENSYAPFAKQKAIATERSSSTGRLSIQSRPSGAQIVLESDSLGQTPVNNHPVRAGVLFVTLTKSGYAPLDTIVITETDHPTTALFELQPLRSSADSSQPRAKDSLTAPSENPTETPAPQPSSSLTASAAVDSPAPDSPASAPSSATDSSAEPSPLPEPTTGQIRVTSTPSPATVWLDGQYRGTTPVTLSDLSPGEHRLSVQKSGYNPYHASVSLEARGNRSIHTELPVQTGTLQVLVIPWGTIYIDNELHKADTDLQYTTELSAGVHQLRISHPVLGNYEQAVEIVSNRTREVVVDLNQNNSSN